MKTTTITDSLSLSKAFQDLSKLLLKGRTEAELTEEGSMLLGTVLTSVSFEPFQIGDKLGIYCLPNQQISNFWDTSFEHLFHDSKNKDFVLTNLPKP